MWIYKSVKRLCILLILGSSALILLSEFFPFLPCLNIMVPYIDSINNLLYNIGISIFVSSIFLFFTIQFLDVRLKKKEIDEEKEEEKARIMRHHKLFESILSQYIIYYNDLSTAPQNNKGKMEIPTIKWFKRTFDIWDLKNMDFIDIRIDGNYRKRIHMFESYEKQLYKCVENMLISIDFKYYPMLETELFVIRNSILEGMTEKISSFFAENASKTYTKIMVSALSETKQNTLEDFERRGISPNLYVPIMIFYAQLLVKRDSIKKYCDLINQIKKE